MISYLIIGLVLTGTVLTILWYTRPRVRCPECGSRKVGQVSKEPLGVRYLDFGGAGGEGGGHSMFQFTYEVTYGCSECRA